MDKNFINKKDGIKVFLETFGCQMNILDSELVEGQFKEAGYKFVKKAEEANIILLNTCSVRKLCEDKIYSRLGMIKDRKENGEKVVVGVLGCMAERAHEELLKTKGFIDVIVGPSKLHDAKELIEKAWGHNEKSKTKTSLSYFVNRKGLTKSALNSPMDDLENLDRLRNISAHTQSYVRITRGCNKFCSFCVVPRTRGPEMHRSPLAIIDEVKKLVEEGAKEITLLGQTINHYFYELESKSWSFADLLFEIHEKVLSLPRLRFLTSYPRDFTDEALDVMASCKRICKYLHIPAQSGSNKILKNMNRGYSIEEYLALIERAKNKIPDLSIVGDMIVGFPDETDEDFLLSLELLKKVQYKNVFIFKYSPRPNTIASKNYIDNIPDNIKKERNNIMLDLQNEINLNNNQKLLNKKLSILVEGEAKLNDNLIDLRTNNKIKLTGRTEGDHIIHFYGDKSLIGQIIDVKITKARALSLDGEI